MWVYEIFGESGSLVAAAENKSAMSASLITCINSTHAEILLYKLFTSVPRVMDAWELKTLTFSSRHPVSRARLRNSNHKKKILTPWQRKT